MCNVAPAQPIGAKRSIGNRSRACSRGEAEEGATLVEIQAEAPSSDRWAQRDPAATLPMPPSGGDSKFKPDTAQRLHALCSVVLPGTALDSFAPASQAHGSDGGLGRAVVPAARVCPTPRLRQGRLRRRYAMGSPPLTQPLRPAVCSAIGTAAAHGRRRADRAPNVPQAPDNDSGQPATMVGPASTPSLRTGQPRTRAAGSQADSAGSIPVTRSRGGRRGRGPRGSASVPGRHGVDATCSVRSGAW